MKVIKYSKLSSNIADAAEDIIDMATSDEDTSSIGLDLGGSQTAVFEIRYLEPDWFYLQESLLTDDDEYIDEESEGEAPYDTIVEYITYRLQLLDQVTDYPRLPNKMKATLAKAAAVAGITLKYDPDQPRDELGRFGSGGGSSRESKPSSGGKIRVLSTQDSQRNIKIDESKLPKGMNRDIKDRSLVLSVYKEKVSNFNEGYKIGADKGAVWNHEWKSAGKAPSTYPKDMPFNPRPQNPKQGDFTSEYKPFADKATMMSWMKEGDLGAHKAKVALHELYEFASKRQGNIDNLTYGSTHRATTMNNFLEKHKLAGFDVDLHHMIPAAMGGSNNGSNVVALTPSEHALAHVLEWSAARVYKSNGEVAKQGKWGGTKPTFEATGANIKANNVYRAVSQQTTAALRSGNVKNYFKEMKSDPARAQALFATQKALSLLKKHGLVDTDDITKLKLDSTGRPKWSNSLKKKDVITKLEDLFTKPKRK